MGLFDRFKEKEPAPQPVNKEQCSDLFLAIQRLKRSQGPETMSELSRILKRYVDDGAWLPMPVEPDANGDRLRIIESRGRAYAAMYSDPAEAKFSGRIVMTDIKKLLEPVFSNRELAGIVIDPETTSLCLDKRFLLKCILHGYLPETRNQGSPQKSWGVGIPKYNQSDLMSEGELLNFAMHTVLGNEDAFSSLMPVSACDHISALPNLIYEDHGRFIFVVVKGYCAEAEPTISDEAHNLLKQYCGLYNATCYYAPVGFRSTDGDRFNACLALKGDGFYAKYVGLTRLI